MRGRLLFVIGAAAGYVIGASRGRAAYDPLTYRAARLWRSPRTQEAVDRAADAVRERVPVVGGILASAIERGSDRIDESVDEPAARTSARNARTSGTKRADDD